MKLYNRLSRRILLNHIVVKNEGKDCRISYFSPQHPNDMKRIGRAMGIKLGRKFMTLDGKNLKSLKNTFRVMANKRDFSSRDSILVKNHGKVCKVYYFSPVDLNDLKREGQNLSIIKDGMIMNFRGPSLRSLRSIVEKINI